MENQSKKMVQIVYDALDEKLGEDIEILKCKWKKSESVKCHDGFS